MSSLKKIEEGIDNDYLFFPITSSNLWLKEGLIAPTSPIHINCN